jgi:hypothetical protein
MIRPGAVSLLAFVPILALTAPSRATEELVVAAVTPVLELGAAMQSPADVQRPVQGVSSVAVSPGGGAQPTRPVGQDEVQIALGPDGQGYVPLPLNLPSRGLGPVGGGAVFLGFYVPYQVQEAEARTHRKIPKPTTSGETVTAWTSAVFLGAPTATRTVIDQWVAAAYYLGPRRR